MLLGNVIEHNFEQELKAFSPIEFTPSSIVTYVSSVQLLKAEFPIDVTLPGMLTDVSLEQ